MSTTRRGLGRGLDALIPINPNTKKEDSEDRIIESKSENKSKVETKATTKSTTKAATKTATKSTSKGATKTTTKNADSKTSKTKQTASKGQTKKEAAKPEVKEVIKEVEIVKEVVKEIPKDTYLKVSEIEPNREQPRKNFDKEALEELAESIKQYGVIQPLVVQKRSDHYEIIAGERRWRAAKLAKIKEVPVVIKDYTEQEIMEIALIENIQREDLNPIEEAEAYRRLIDEYNLLQEDLAKKVSKSRTAIANSMRLLKLGDEVKEMLVNNEISSGHARTLISIEDKGIQLEVAKQIVEKKLSVRETEKLVKNVLNPKPEKIVSEVDTQVEAIYKNLEDRLKTIVGTKVNISRSKKGKGKIEIEYYSQDDLERILDLFGTIN